MVMRGFFISSASTPSRSSAVPEVLPEDYVFPPTTECSQCWGLMNEGWLKEAIQLAGERGSTAVPDHEPDSDDANESGRRTSGIAREQGDFIRGRELRIRVRP
jgi:hypothetical protein